MAADDRKPAANVTQAVPFLKVTDMTAALAFYADGLGFEMTNRWIDEGVLRWCYLQRGGGALMLQQFATEGHDSWVPDGKLGAGVILCFFCEDALAIYREAKDRGLSPRRPYVGNGLWVTSLSDPDGYQVDFESPTDVAEETEYAEV